MTEAPSLHEAREFSITDPLPQGTVLLEASAGTGKTWTIAALVTRFVAEGHADIDDLLVVTFGRAASAELRDRVRERLVESDAVLTTGEGAGQDPLFRLLLDADEATVSERRRRIRRAIARFDEATITTTHGFCHAVLRSLGTTGDVEPGATLIEDDSDIVSEVVADLYLRAVGRQQVPPFTPKEARVLGRRAVEDPAAKLLPLDAEPDSVPDIRRRFAGAVRDESARRRLAARTLSYDDLLQRLAEALEPAESAARVVMRDRWKFVLVDEFQDTDPIQWQILERAFLGHRTMVLVGDPKQAIYAFRGGDVHTYLRAASEADERRTLVLNYRSDEPLVASVDAVLRGAALGDPQIVVRPARAALHGSRLNDPRSSSPFRLRVLTRSDADVEPGKTIKIADARDRIAADVAADIAALLASGATYADGDSQRPLEAGDVAVLVERHLEAQLLQDALADLQIPAVRGGGADVLRSEAADHWVTLLTALDAPHRSGVVRAAALGPFFGYPATELVADGQINDHVTDDVSARLRELTDVLRDRGTAGMVEAVTADAGVMERILKQSGGQRLLTDVEHVGYVLHSAARERGLGLAGLLRWLLDRRAEATQVAADRTRRLDSDADAVQIVTTFVSKGLQYPVVYAPFLFDRYVGDPDAARFHDDAGQRCLDVGGGGPSRSEHVARAQAEQAGESLRLLYVAMTRAQSRLVMHWAPTWNGKNAALHRLLFGRAQGDADVPQVCRVPGDNDAVPLLRAWQEQGGPTVERMELAQVGAVSPHAAPRDLSVRHLTRSVDTIWTRTSYSSLVRRDDLASVGSEPDHVGPDDEVDVAVEAESAAMEPSPWADLVGGAALGTLVHEVLEATDVTADDVVAEVRQRVDEQLVLRPLDVDREALATVLTDVLHTPMGPLVDDLTLREALRLKPFREMDFELPLAGGDAVSASRTTATLADIADLMEDLLPQNDPLRPFAPQLRDATLRGRTLRGYLNGSIDLLLRTPDARTLVVDYKTNRLEVGDGGLDAYAPDQLASAMLHTTYPLQALLYAVAQHRFLRWRMRDYDPEVHLAGVLYLFVRGMTGPDVPRDHSGAPYGVFSWEPPAALILALSDLLDGRGRP